MFKTILLAFFLTLSLCVCLAQEGEIDEGELVSELFNTCPNPSMQCSHSGSLLDFATRGLCSFVCRLAGTDQATEAPTGPQHEFYEKLLNPCRISEVIPGRQVSHNLRQNLIAVLKDKALQVKADADVMIRDNTLRDCASLGLSNVARIPSADAVRDQNPLGVLRDFYGSFLNHTAYVYFMSEQLEKYSSAQCYDADKKAAADSAAAKMLELNCILRFLILSMPEGEFENDNAYVNNLNTQMLSEPLVDLNQCSRRLLRDCQIISSSVKLVTELASYLKDNDLVYERESR